MKVTVGKGWNALPLPMRQRVPPKQLSRDSASIASVPFIPDVDLHSCVRCVCVNDLEARKHLTRGGIQRCALCDGDGLTPMEWAQISAFYDGNDEVEDYVRRKTEYKLAHGGKLFGT